MPFETTAKHPLSPGFEDALVKPADYARFYDESF